MGGGSLSSRPTGPLRCLVCGAAQVNIFARTWARWIDEKGGASVVHPSLYLEYAEPFVQVRKGAARTGSPCCTWNLERFSSWYKTPASKLTAQSRPDGLLHPSLGPP